MGSVSWADLTLPMSPGQWILEISQYCRNGIGLGVITNAAYLSMHILAVTPLPWPRLVTCSSPALVPALSLRSSQKQESQSTILRPRLVLAKHPVNTFGNIIIKRMVSSSFIQCPPSGGSRTGQIYQGSGELHLNEQDKIVIYRVHTINVSAKCI